MALTSASLTPREADCVDPSRPGEKSGLLAAAQSNAGLCEKLLSFTGKSVFFRRLLVSSDDKFLRNKLIKNLRFICIQIRAVSF
jgi:hypothetical protein